ncbi:uncharacterized protein DFL_000054 [Arthrobotrys flagrans]|uniref:F-box domain-containing protein n=1 Tax=Arthrobotrys flagrans TaxID=97331 RepID=A0A437AE38_ARTFL|nr:hypothetical protein DFL_000054 [Arthrobotrys flagrans]
MADSAFRLLDFPPEIRETIYFHLADISRGPLEPDLKTQLLPPEPSVIFDCSYRPRGRAFVSPIALSVYYPTTLKYSLLPILQTCRQIRSEFQRFITLLQRKPGGDLNPLGYTLDVEAYHSEIFLKWTRLQLPPEIPYNIIPELRINYNVMHLRRKHNNSLRFFGDGGLWDEGLGLFTLLSDFFHHGPQGVYNPAVNAGDDGGRCGAMFVQKLVFNVKLVYAPDLNKWFDEIIADALEDGPDSVAESQLNMFTTGMKDLKCSILKGFADWISTFLNVGHLDGVVGTVQVLWDGAEEWDKPLNPEDLETPPGNMKAFFDITGTERRAEITEPWGWEKYVWGRREELWADRWVHWDGV